MVVAKVQLLDGNDFTFQVDQKKAVGNDIFKKVIQKLELQQSDYFCCTYKDPKGVKFWLNNEKKVAKQIETGPWEFNFEVKFYPPDPTVISNELTRYQLFLQLRIDVLRGRLPCSFVTLALLGSYAAQSQLGDYDPSEHGQGFQYLKSISFGPNQTDELLDKISELHRTHRGMAPMEAELQYLENAKKLSLYGVHIHYAKIEEDNSDVQIGVCAFGLLIYKDRLRISRFTWPKILKISYKRNIFTIKIRPGEFEEMVTTFDYKLTNYTMAKRLWKLAVEHHAFFRLRESEPVPVGLFSRFAPRGQKVPVRTHYMIQQESGDGRPAGSGTYHINRSAARQFAQSLENVMGGHATERKEQYDVNQSRTATLDLKNRNRQGSVPTLDTWSTDEPQYHGIGPYGYGTGVTYASEASGGEYELGNNPQHGGQVNGMGGNAGGTEQRYMNPNYAGSESSYNHSTNQYDTYNREYQQGGGGVMVDEYGRPIGSGMMGGQGGDPRYMTGGRGGVNQYEGEEGMHPSQYDRLNERGGGAGGMGGQWSEEGTGSRNMGGEKTTTRTYTDADGNIVTEIRTERGGVIETRIEKRHQVISGGVNDDFDYDKALADAILAVTNVNTDLSVEKIEIQTTEENDDIGHDDASETLI